MPSSTVLGGAESERTGEALATCHDPWGGGGVQLPCCMGGAPSDVPQDPAGHGQGSPTSPCTAAFPELPHLAALAGGERAGRRGHAVEEGKVRSLPRTAAPSQCRLSLCPLPLLGRGPCLSAPNPFLHPENPFITDTIPDPEDQRRAGCPPHLEWLGLGNIGDDV